MTMTDQNDFDLGPFFDAAKARHSAPEADVMARVLADGLAVQAQRSTEVSRPGPKRSWVGAMVAGLGGWPTLGGLVTAGVCGVWVGLYPPSALAPVFEVTQSAFGADSFIGEQSSFSMLDLAAFDVEAEG